MTDDELLDALERIDADDDVEVTDWEAEFLDSLQKQRRAYRVPPLTDRQRAVAERMVERYGGGRWR